ncbi:squalene/phytoene synthase family protein [Streptomyces sp. NPDC093546]|uniref:squalene/phytoene synthase family protein n=1 Tax=Streptomyces sp. NPDC093546 TaxID=3366040 RepID=UPI00380FE154
MWKRALDRAGVGEARLRRDYTEQRRAVRRYRPAEYAAARLLLPAGLLPHVVAAVAFMHETDDRIDRGADDERAGALAEWDGLVRKAFAEGVSGLPVLRCLTRTAERHPDVRGHVEDFLRGCAREAAWRTIADDEELERYVREYSLPGLMLTACLLAPAEPPAREAFTAHCHVLIRAMQRLDFLEDLAEDVRAGRPGIPADAVARHGADLTRPGPELGRLVGRRPLPHKQLPEPDQLKDPDFVQRYQPIAERLRAALDARPTGRTGLSAGTVKTGRGKDHVMP